LIKINNYKSKVSLERHTLAQTSYNKDKNVCYWFFCSSYAMLLK